MAGNVLCGKRSGFRLRGLEFSLARTFLCWRGLEKREARGGGEFGRNEASHPCRFLCERVLSVLGMWLSVGWLRVICSDVG